MPENKLTQSFQKQNAMKFVGSILESPHLNQASLMAVSLTTKN